MASLVSSTLLGVSIELPAVVVYSNGAVLLLVNCRSVQTQPMPAGGELETRNPKQRYSQGYIYDGTGEFPPLRGKAYLTKLQLLLGMVQWFWLT